MRWFVAAMKWGAALAMAVAVPLLAACAGMPMTGAGHGTGVFLALAAPGVVCLPLFAILYGVTRKSEDVIISLIPWIVHVAFLVLILVSIGDRERSMISLSIEHLGPYVAAYSVLVAATVIAPPLMVGRRVLQVRRPSGAG